MNKLTSVLMVAAAMALAAPQMATALPLAQAGHKSALARPAKRVKKGTQKKALKQLGQSAMKTKRTTKKRVVSHRKSPKQIGSVNSQKSV